MIDVTPICAGDVMYRRAFSRIIAQIDSPFRQARSRQFHKGALLMTAEFMRAFVEGIEPAFRRGDSTVENKIAETENVRVLREFYRAIERGDSAAVSAYLHDEMDLEITGPPSLPILGRWRGREEVAAAVARNFAMLKNQRPEIRSLIAQGDTVVVLGREEGLLVATKASYAVHWAQVYRFQDGRIAQLHEIIDGYSVADADPDSVARA